jgi:cold shock CspA family protein
MKTVERLRQSIVAHINGLEQRCGRMTACRVLARSSMRSTFGWLCRMVEKSMSRGQRRKTSAKPTVDFAINDGFKRTRRPGQCARAPPIGTVIRLDPLGGFGFLETAYKREVYFHKNSVLNGGFARLGIGTRAAFAEEAGEKAIAAARRVCFPERRRQP